jgi:hypothetical protein
MDNASFSERFRDLLYFACDKRTADMVFFSVRKASESDNPDEIDLGRLRQRYGGIPLDALRSVNGVGRVMALRLAERCFRQTGVPITLNGSPEYGRRAV